MKRYLDATVLKNFQNTKLWQDKIKNDCINHKVFLTIRDNRIDLYHKGGKLFSFSENNFKTHIKYASVIDVENTDTDNDQCYLSEFDLKSLQLIPDYYTGYKRIKENCSKYSGVEARGVSELYHKYSYFSNNEIIVLDIEVSFVSLDPAVNKKDRVDFVLLNKKSGIIQFIEAKHFSNDELWRPKVQPKVIKQIRKYEGQVRERRKDILYQYQEYINCINNIFNLALPNPTEIDDRVTLFIFGFDDNQKKGRLATHIIENNYFKDIKTYQKGDIKDFKMNALWKGSVL